MVIIDRHEKIRDYPNLLRVRHHPCFPNHMTQRPNVSCSKHTSIKELSLRFMSLRHVNTNSICFKCCYQDMLWMLKSFANIFKNSCIQP
jgi:hypothetical protein